MLQYAEQSLVILEKIDFQNYTFISRQSPSIVSVIELNFLSN
jgi:hypothetical protein